QAALSQATHSKEYIDATWPMNLGEALVYLDERHGYSFDFILDLPFSLRHVLVHCLGNRDVRVDGTIDDVSARWLVDRAPEGEKDRVRGLISEEGKGLFAAFTHGSALVAQNGASTRPAARKEEERKEIEE
ncbi:hypothetical protein LTR53_006495, partial [Teratosphaeriaceae sp. CCFEE 6253]